MNKQTHIVSRPNGMTVSDFKKRPQRTAAEDLNSDQNLVSSVGLNTSGALSGIRASSFPNPPMGPPAFSFDHLKITKATSNDDDNSQAAQRRRHDKLHRRRAKQPAKLVIN